MHHIHNRSIICVKSATLYRFTALSFKLYFITRTQLEGHQNVSHCDRCRETRQCPEIQVTTGTAEGSLAVYAKTCPPPPATHTISLFIGLHTLANRLETYQKKPLTASSSLTFYPTLGTRHRWRLSLAAALGDRLCWRSSAFSPMEEHSFTNSRLSSISVLIRKVKTRIQPRSTKPRSAIRNCTTSHPKHCWHFFHV